MSLHQALPTHRNELHSSTSCSSNRSNKGHGCADGCKQCVYKNKEDTSSPAISIDALFLTCMVDALEQQDLVTCDVPGAFMQADINKLIHVHLDGDLAQVLLKVDPSYKKFLSFNGTSPSSMQSWTRLYMEHCRQLSFSGRSSDPSSWSPWDLPPTPTIIVLSIKRSRDPNTPSGGMLMILNYCTSTPM